MNMIRRRSIGGALLPALVVLGMVSGCSGVEWEEFESGEGAFMVTMPGTPSVQTSVLNTPAGALDLHLFSGEVNRIRYVVGYCDYPERVARFVNNERLLEDVREGTLSAARGTLIGEAPVSLGTHPGKEIRMKLPDSLMEGGGGYRSRLFVVGPRLYQIAVSAPDDRAFTAEADSFFNSFRLTDR